IHYIGDLLGHTPFRCMLDQMSNGQLQWEPLENAYDHVILGPLENRRSYPIYSGSTRFPEELKKRFPGEEKAIDDYMRLVKKTEFGIWLLLVLKLCPLPLAKFLIHTGLVKHLSFFFKMAPRSLTDVVNELTENKDLRAVFTYIFGTYGNKPKDASFAMHSLLITHYLNGAWYPKGGSSEIAYHMIPIIEKAGGAVLVRAPVNRILFNDAKEAYGKSTLSLVSFAKYSWFEEWKDGKVTNRGADYKELKQAFINSALDVVMDVFPKISRDKDRMCFCVVSLAASLELSPVARSFLIEISIWIPSSWQ
ncbi:hypothetical protein GOODEAATRI_009688, partial [Goodea atripinnis]